MKHDTQVKTLKTLLELRERDRDQVVKEHVVKIPVQNYLAEDILEREMATVFRDCPLVAGHASQVREPGSYLLSVWNKLPYVIVRDRSGELRAFINVCSHRGTCLVSGKEKSLNALVCPYHGWTYNLDGSLQSVTKAFNFPDLEFDKFGLKELPVTEHQDLIWIHPTSGASIDLESYLGPDINSDLEHFGLDKLVLHRKKTVTKNANWKLLLKTYLDRYHVPILHRNTIAEFFKKGVIAHFEHGPHIRISAGLTNLPKAAEIEPEAWKILNYASVLYTLFPNTYLIIHSNLVSINMFYPLAPDKTIWTHEMLYRDGDYAGEEGQAALAQRFANIDAVFEHEDFWIAESCQQGLHYGNEFHTLGLEEGLLAIFQENIDRMLV